MKNLFSVLLLICMAFSAFAEGETTDLFPPFVPSKGYELWTNGFTRFSASTEKINDGKNFEWSVLRTDTTIKTPNPEFGGFLQFDLVNFDQEDSDWLKQAYLKFQPDKNWTFRLGRFFVAAPYWTTPSYKELKTVHFPYEPWGYYAYGLQAQGDLGDGWNVITDITTSTGFRFNEDEQFESIEWSGHLGKKITKNLTAGVDAQIGEDFVRTGIDFSWNVAKDLTLTGEVYCTAQDENVYGGYLFGNYEINKYLQVHSQVDYQRFEDCSNTIFTNGILLRPGDDQVWLIVDYEWHVDDRDKNGFYAVIEVRF